jgi:hypothetical protein
MISHHKSAITCLDYDGLSIIVSANWQGYILLIDINGSLKQILSNSHCVEPITCIKLQGALILASTNRGKLMFWNKKINRCESILCCHECSINAISFFDQKFYTVAE